MNVIAVIEQLVNDQGMSPLKQIANVMSLASDAHLKK